MHASRFHRLGHRKRVSDHSPRDLRRQFADLHSRRPFRYHGHELRHRNRVRCRTQASPFGRCTPVPRARSACRSTPRPARSDPFSPWRSTPTLGSSEIEIWSTRTWKEEFVRDDLLQLSVLRPLRFSLTAAGWQWARATVPWPSGRSGPGRGRGLAGEDWRGRQDRLPARTQAEVATASEDGDRADLASPAGPSSTTSTRKEASERRLVRRASCRRLCSKAVVWRSPTGGRRDRNSGTL